MTMLRSRLTRARPQTVLGLALACAVPTAALADIAPVKDGVSQVAITLTGENGGSCVLDHNSAKAGPVTFTVTNESAPAISEIELMNDNRILGEKENLAPGLPVSRFTVTLDGGDYQVYCPNAATGDHSVFSDRQGQARHRLYRRSVAGRGEGLCPLRRRHGRCDGGCGDQAERRYRSRGSEGGQGRLRQGPTVL
ncbi:MAG: hypothetical protein AB7S99_02690 [Pseudodonghicola sp.]